jgi:uncharacterized protein (DUF3820 family)
LAIVLSVLLWFMDSDYPFGIFQLFFVLVAIMLCVLLWFMDSDYPFGIFKFFSQYIFTIQNNGVLFSEYLFLSMQHIFVSSFVFLRPPIDLIYPATFNWSGCAKPREWVVMYLCVRGIDFVTLSAIFLLDFGTFPTV